MAGIINNPDKASAGNRPSATAWNRINTSLSRVTVGARVIAGSEGTVTVPRGLSGGGRKRFCVLRTVDTGTPLIEVQEVVEQPSESKLTGEDGQRYHVGAIGDVFEAYPSMNGTYAQFNVQGAVRPVADIVASENLSGAALFEFDRQKRLTLVYRWAENIAFIDPEATEAGGGGV